MNKGRAQRRKDAEKNVDFDAYALASAAALREVFLQCVQAVYGISPTNRIRRVTFDYAGSNSPREPSWISSRTRSGSGMPRT